MGGGVGLKATYIYHGGNDMRARLTVLVMVSLMSTSAAVAQAPSQDPREQNFICKVSACGWVGSTRGVKSEVNLFHSLRGRVPGGRRVGTVPGCALQAVGMHISKHGDQSAQLTVYVTRRGARIGAVPIINMIFNHEQLTGTAPVRVPSRLEDGAIRLSCNYVRPSHEPARDGAETAPDSSDATTVEPATE